MRKSTISPVALLRQHGLKVTPLRVAIIAVLRKTATPLTIDTIAQHTRNIADIVTYYRTLNTFTSKRITRRIPILPEKDSFELVQHASHLHHIICVSCHKVEPIDLCKPNINRLALQKSKRFSTVDDHSLSFSGTCKKCIRAIP